MRTRSMPPRWSALQSEKRKSQSRKNCRTASASGVLCSLLWCPEPQIT